MEVLVKTCGEYRASLGSSSAHGPIPSDGHLHNPDKNIGKTPT